MNVTEFLLSRPCYEEIEGYLWGLRWQIENPDPDHPSPHPEINADVLGPIEQYKLRLNTGKETPAPSKLDRDWDYTPRKKPKKKRTLPDEPEWDPIEDEPARETLHADKGFTRRKQIKPLRLRRR